jgi:hypothetical protein
VATKGSEGRGAMGSEGACVARVEAATRAAEIIRGAKRVSRRTSRGSYRRLVPERASGCRISDSRACLSISNRAFVIII